LNKVILLFVFTVISLGFGNFVFAQEMSHVTDPLVVLETDLGTIVIELFMDDAPLHVENFILLSKFGDYDGTLFHRIIPGFMIQGGDPNTITGLSTTWGQGGQGKLTDTIDSEFNTIKHNRGIVSMARSADPNSAGSQFFIVHQNSNFLDGEYTVFGRIVTGESFETLDKIAELETTPDDKPISAYLTKIIKATVVERSSIPNILDLSPPERTGQQEIMNSDGSANNQIFENKSLNIRFSAPEGWLLQQPDKTIPNSPDVVAVGPKIDGINPVISLTITDAGNKNLDEIIIEKNNSLQEAVYLNKLIINSQEKIKPNVYQTNAIGNFETDGVSFQIEFKEVTILSEGKTYTFAYSNTIDNFDNHLSQFNDSLNSFQLLSQKSPIMEDSTETLSEEGGGCLIATAAYGSELAPQIQMLREIRDNQLMNTESGKSFMATFNDIYYSFSPTIADMERESPVFKEIVKAGLTPMLSTLAIMENAESESEVLGLGLSVIALNLGMYIGLPAFGILRLYEIKKQ